MSRCLSDGFFLRKRNAVLLWCIRVCGNKDQKGRTGGRPPSEPWVERNHETRRCPKGRIVDGANDRYVGETGFARELLQFGCTSEPGSTPDRRAEPPLDAAKSRPSAESAELADDQ